MPVIPTVNTVSWAPNPDGRGTIDLLWTCFATVFLCTWSAVHPNLPGLSEKGSRIFRRRLLHVLYCIIAPEAFAAAAVRDLADAVVLKAKAPGWSLQQCFFFLMGGFVIQETPYDSERFRPNPKKLLPLLESGAIPWPTVPVDDIKGRSRADWLTKAISMVQILYFITSLVGRWAQGLAITTLELFTLGIVVCAIVTFMGYWSKPFDVQIPIVIYSAANISNKDCTDRVTFTEFDPQSSPPWWTRLGGGIIGIAFGALHIAAWNFYFPSQIEQLLWRISSIMCTVILCCMMLQASEAESLDDGWSGRIFTLSLCLYLLVRTYMFVEMFASLRAVPESVYQTPNWSQYFPFLG